MQVIHSVIIHEGDSLSLAEIQSVVTLQRMGKDINEKERTHAFRNAFSLIILLIVFVVSYLFIFDTAFTFLEIFLGAALASLVSALILNIQTQTKFPVIQDSEFGLKVFYKGGASVLFWHKSSKFVTQVAEALKESMLRQPTKDINWYIDFKSQAIKFCRRKSLRESVLSLIKKAKSRLHCVF